MIFATSPSELSMTADEVARRLAAIMAVDATLAQAVPS